MRHTESRRLEKIMPIRSRLDDLPAFEIRESQLRAQDYNLVQIAHKRLGSPLRIELPRLRSLDFVFENEAWAIVDRSLNDIPIIAWLNFHATHRDSLHQPISCQRRTYHTHATIIVDKALEAMHLLLGEKLARVNEGNGDVIAMKLKRPH
jgi:hypothetical protein